MNSFEAISGLVAPRDASVAIWASCGVRSLRVSGLRLRAVSPVAASSSLARSAKPAAPMASNRVKAARSCSRASTRRLRRRSHSP
jgi:hypothetical protein